jgi:hypothetical protein
MKRRLTTRGITAEDIDPILVFDRHEWQCAYCRCDTPRDKRGTYDDDAPELDHVVPIAKGGEHSYANVQLLCRACNGSKVDLIVQRYSLVKHPHPSPLPFEIFTGETGAGQPRC